MKRLLVLLLILGLLLPGGCVSQPVPELTVCALSIGKADSILLTDGTHSVLIDAGEEEDGEKVLAALAQAGIERLDCVIFTHFDKDHIGGAPDLLSGIPVTSAFMPAYEPGGKRYEALLTALQEAGIPTERLSRDVSFSIGRMAIDVWAPKAAYDGDDNNQSLVVRVQFGNRRVLLMGDAEEARTQELLDGGYDLACDVLKLPHHGRLHETSAALLAAASPGFAIITDSEKNPAAEELLSLLDAKEVEVLRTADGTARLILSEDEIRVQPDGD